MHVGPVITHEKSTARMPASGSRPAGGGDAAAAGGGAAAGGAAPGRGAARGGGARAPRHPPAATAGAPGHPRPAAPVLARRVRARLMTRLAGRYPALGWAANKGYATADHLAALEASGPTPHHRRSFAPVVQLRLL